MTGFLFIKSCREITEFEVIRQNVWRLQGKAQNRDGWWKAKDSIIPVPDLNQKTLT
jgi:hypothetical protein